MEPCGVCGERVGCNSIKCTKCQRWVHCRCSYVLRHMSLGHNCTAEKLEFKRGEDVLEEKEKFCYLDDMISCYVGA